MRLLKKRIAAHRQDADPFLLRDRVDEALLGGGRHGLQRRADGLQVAHELADARLVPRLGHEAVEERDRRGLREHEGDDHHGERAPHERRREEAHFCAAPSGMKT
jgi:hypothetical protein